MGAVGPKAPRQRHIEAVDDQTVTDMMEQLQEGYVASAAATAGCNAEFIRKDNWGIDAQIIRPPRAGVPLESTLYLQLKCTTLVTPDPERHTFSYQFTKRRYFDALAQARSYPKAILVVMTVPKRQLEWTQVDHSGMHIRRCCYWAHLEGVQVDPGVAKPTVHIPTKNKFDAAALSDIFDRLG